MVTHAKIILVKDNMVTLVGALLILFIVGCGTAIHSPNLPNYSEFSQDLSEYHNPLEPNKNTVIEPSKEPIGEITLRDAIAVSLLHSPRLTRYAWKVRIREAQTLQSTVLPNPEIEIEVEEFGGSGDLSGFDSAETTVLFSQLIEFGQKRQKRLNTAQLNQELATWDYEATRVSVLADVTRAFSNLLLLQERKGMMQDNLSLAKKVYNAINKRIQAGAASPLDLTKAKVEVAKAKIEFQRIQRDLRSARIQLAAKWGSQKPQFDRAKGKFLSIKDLPSIEALSEQISKSPQIARWAYEMTQRKAQIEYEESKAVSDMEIGLGMRHLNESDDAAAVFNVSIPLTVFNRNQGDVRVANYELEIARHLKREAELRVNSELSKYYQNISAAFEEIKALEAELLPAAKQAYDGTHTAYIEGKVGYLQVLDAQRTLFEARRQHLEALVAYNRFAIEVEALVGLPLSEVGRAEKETESHEGE